MVETAYVLQRKHFVPYEMNYMKLNEFVKHKNVFLEYDIQNNSNNTHFKTSIYQLNKFGYNIGIILVTDKEYIIDNIDVFINDIKGYSIKLGVYTNNMSVFSNLLKYKDHFIPGMNQDEDSEYPRLGKNGDVQYSDYVKTSFTKDLIPTVFIHNNYSIIYDNNNLKPL